MKITITISDLYSSTHNDGTHTHTHILAKGLTSNINILARMRRKVHWNVLALHPMLG